MNEIDVYIGRQPSPQKEICRKLRKIVLDTIPGANEEMKWGVPTFARGLYYIVALKDHVNLGFSSKNLSKKDMALFDGGGKTTRHIQIDSPNLDRERIVRLLRLAGASRKPK
ncbi:MAG: DUF1801 domain-containing protein [Bacteroidetes bacterium]|nr:DUF1801 domain-containing protein [Bacteroidota bacterium]